MVDNKKPKSKAARNAGIAATVLWIISIILTCTIPAGTRFVFLGDALLLIGFFPLLWVWRPGWPWIVFGLLNIFIGFFLEIAYQLPEQTFTPEMIAVRNHLRDQHNALTWMLLGFGSFVFGLVRTIRQIIGWVSQRRNRTSKQDDTVSGEPSA